jgi:hypothetical protein
MSWQPLMTILVNKQLDARTHRTQMVQSLPSPLGAHPYLFNLADHFSAIIRPLFPPRPRWLEPGVSGKDPELL